jgi:hypothetical protein
MGLFVSLIAVWLLALYTLWPVYVVQAAGAEAPDQGAAYWKHPGLVFTRSVDSEVVYAGDTVTFTYQVGNAGDVPVSVGVSDDQCSPLTFTGGDSNGNGELDLDEVWAYTCETTVNVDIVSTATATVTHPIGGVVSSALSHNRS